MKIKLVKNISINYLIFRQLRKQNSSRTIEIKLSGALTSIMHKH